MENENETRRDDTIDAHTLTLSYNTNEWNEMKKKQYNLYRNENVYTE